MKYLRGIHLAADITGEAPWYWPYHDDFLINEISKMNMEAAKGWSTIPLSVLERVMDVLESPQLFVHRLPIMGEDSRDINHLLNRFVPTLRKLVERGHIYVEPHNEPNLYREGLGRWYANGKEYGSWLHTFTEQLRQEVPGLQIAFPAMSPGPLNERRVPEGEFTEAMWAETSMAHYDWISLHAYWLNRGMIMPAILRVLDVCQRFPSLPIMVTEFGNLSNELDNIKAVEYNIWYDVMHKLKPNMAASFLWVLSSSGEAHKHHVVAGTEIPGLLGMKH